MVVRYAVSTHLYHHRRLTLEHLQEIAAHGFDALELFATSSHFDYHDPRAIEELAAWLGRAGLTLHSIHAPIVERNVEGQWLGPLSLAANDEAARAHAVAETAAALDIAQAVPTAFLVVHLGLADDVVRPPAENSLSAAVKSLGEVVALAAPLGVRVALEVIPNRLSSAEALTRLLEDELDLPGAGICLDFGHAAIMGDLVDAIETVSGLLVTTHVHDNHGRDDEHLAPFEGATDWDAALMSLQKIGYEGTLVFEVAHVDTPGLVLDRTRQARRRFEAILNT